VYRVTTYKVEVLEGKVQTEQKKMFSDDATRLYYFYSETQLLCLLLIGV